MFQIDHIRDALGRRVTFQYRTAGLLPYISGFSVEGDPYGRLVRYEIDDAGLLRSARDVGGRPWSYDYESNWEEGEPYLIPFSLERAARALGGTRVQSS